jgi:hypothetical protein
MSSKQIIHGFKDFAKYLKGSYGRFAQSPVLLIQSHSLLGGKGEMRESTQVAHACRRVNFMVSQQLGLRTVQVHSSADYPFPQSPNTPETTLQLAKRTGAGTVIAVGSGQAIDLAKTVAKHFQTTILVPATYGATMVAGMSHALLLDKQEETLLPAECESTETLIVASDEEFVQTDTRDTAIWAAVALLLDAVLRSDQNMDTAPISELLKVLITNLHNDATHDKGCHEQLCKALLDTGSLASYGLGPSDRSIPIAILASLLPTAFAASDSMALLASTVPSLHRILLKKHAKYAQKTLLDEYRMSNDVPRIVTTEPLNDLMSRIHENQVLWKCFDANDTVLRDVLHDHLLIV